MKIDKLFKGIEKLFFSEYGEKKQEKLKDKLLKKITKTKKELRDASKEEDKENLKDKLYILKKLLERVWDFYKLSFGSEKWYPCE